MPEIACVRLRSYADDEALIASVMVGAAEERRILDLIAEGSTNPGSPRP